MFESQQRSHQERSDLVLNVRNVVDEVIEDLHHVGVFNRVITEESVGREPILTTICFEWKRHDKQGIVRLCHACCVSTGHSDHLLIGNRWCFAGAV